MLFYVAMQTTHKPIVANALAWTFVPIAADTREALEHKLKENNVSVITGKTLPSKRSGGGILREVGSRSSDYWEPEDLEAIIRRKSSKSSEIVHRFFIFVLAIILYAFVDGVMALFSRILITYGVVFIYIFVTMLVGLWIGFSLLERLLCRCANRQQCCERPSRNLTRSVFEEVDSLIPWLGRQRRLAYHISQETYFYVANVAMVVFAFLLLEGGISLLANSVYNKACSEGVLAGFGFVMFVWHLAAMLFCRSSISMLVFPAWAFWAWIFFHMEFFTSFCGFYGESLASLTWLTVLILMFLVYRVESTALNSGIVSVQKPRVSLVFTDGSVSRGNIPPLWTIFHFTNSGHILRRRRQVMEEAQLNDHRENPTHTHEDITNSGDSSVYPRASQSTDSNDLENQDVSETIVASTSESQTALLYDR